MEEMANGRKDSSMADIEEFLTMKGYVAVRVEPRTNMPDGWPGLRLTRDNGESIVLPHPIVTCLMLLSDGATIPQYARLGLGRLSQGFGFSEKALKRLVCVGSSLIAGSPANSQWRPGAGRSASDREVRVDEITRTRPSAKS
jgi:hypothetical protein